MNVHRTLVKYHISAKGLYESTPFNVAIGATLGEEAERVIVTFHKYGGKK